MAEPAGHPDPIGTDQILVVVIGRIGEIALRVPALRRGLVEIGVREQAQPHDAGRKTVIRAYRDRPPARADLHSGIFRFVGERIGGAVRAPHVEHQAEAVRFGLAWRLEARLVDHAEIAPAPVAVCLLCRIVCDDLEQIECAKGAGGHPVPETVVAAGPQQPGVAALDLVGRKRNTAVHIVEIVFAGGREGSRVAPGGTRLVENLAGPWTTVEASEEQHAEQSGCPARQRSRP